MTRSKPIVLQLFLPVIVILCIFSVNAKELPEADNTSTDGHLMVSEGWVRLMPPVAKNSAAYFVLHNNGEQDITITGVSTPAAESAMLHDMTTMNGMMSMKHLMKLVVSPGGEIEFLPGGKHLMMLNLTKKLVADEKIPFTFELEDGKKVHAEMTVK